MSIWTHVAGCFRLNSFRPISDEKIIEKFGRTVLYDDENWPKTEEEKSKTLPMGSEGSLEIQIWHNPDPAHIASTTVSVFGDLRDYDSFEQLEIWFNNVCEKFWVRQAVMLVDVGGYGQETFVYEPSNEDEN